MRLVMRLEMRLVHGSLGRTEGREGLQSCWVEGGMEVGRDLVWSGGSEGRGWSHYGSYYRSYYRSYYGSYHGSYHGSVEMSLVKVGGNNRWSVGWSRSLI